MARFVRNRNLQNYKPSTALRMPTGGTGIRPVSPVEGLFRFNSDTKTVEVYYNSVWNSVAKEGVSNIVKDQFTGTGATNTFVMSYSYVNGKEAQVLIFVGGVFQVPGTAYSFNGTTTLTFATNPPLGQTIVVLHNFPSTVTV